MMTNTLALGAAYQRGLLPVSGEALERAIELNGAAVEKNLAALRWGRAVVAAPDAVEAATRAPEAVEAARELTDLDEYLVGLAVNGDRGELRRLAEVRVPELVAYQNADWARRWAEVVRRVHVAEQERTPGHSEITEAVARQLFKLMAYKDEYEVARLHLDAVERAKRDAEFGAGAKVYFMLHPPLLRALGLKRKLKLGRWFVPAFKLLYRMRRLRGTRLDPFGHAKVRRTERELIAEYESLVDEALSLLTPETHDTALELLELPGRDPRLRGDQAAQRRALPQARRRDPEAPARREAGSRAAEARLALRLREPHRLAVQGARVVAGSPSSSGSWAARPPAGSRGSSPSSSRPARRTPSGCSARASGCRRGRRSRRTSRSCA